MTINPEFVTATALDELSDRIESRELIPRLVRRLLTRTEGVEGVTVRANGGSASPAGMARSELRKARPTIIFARRAGLYAEYRLTGG